MGQALAAVRDIAIVLLALESIVIGVLLCLVLVQLRKLARLLREEIAPILDTTTEAVNTVHGTVDIVSQTVVNPLVKVKSFTTGTRAALRNLIFISRAAKGQKSKGDHS